MPGPQKKEWIAAASFVRRLRASWPPQAGRWSSGSTPLSGPLLKSTDGWTPPATGDHLTSDPNPGIPMTDRSMPNTLATAPLPSGWRIDRRLLGGNHGQQHATI